MFAPFLECCLMEVFFVLLALAAAFVLYFVLKASSTTTVHEYEKGLKYVNGACRGIVGTGRYRFWTNNSTIVKRDMRVQPLSITGQEMPTKDNVGVRVSVIGHYQIVDLKKAVHDTANDSHELHTTVQLALRDSVAKLTLDELMAQRKTLETEVLKSAGSTLVDFGLDLKDLAVRDIMLPASIKKSLSGVIEAQKDTLRNLEKVRGEHAVLRSLANAANLYKDNPALLNARLIQTLELGGNSIVFGAEGMQIKAKPESSSTAAPRKK
jgi:regulator of protease activity HflC (stomatin/prohibitin superfamily)